METQNGEWYLVHLCGRPLPGEEKRCTLGRETAIQKLVWHDDGWPRLATGGNEPAVNVPAPDLAAQPWPATPACDDFNSESLDVNFSSLRIPMDESWVSLKERPGFLRIYGRESLSSRHHQSLVARRIQAFDITASTCLEFQPDDYQQMAGLVFIYDVETWYYLHLRGADDGTIGLNVKMMDQYSESEALENDILIDRPVRLYLKGRMSLGSLTFGWSTDNVTWHSIDRTFDASKLSDEYRQRASGGNFTGAFVGLACQDFTAARKYADFDWFSYSVSDGVGPDGVGPT